VENDSTVSQKSPPNRGLGHRRSKPPPFATTNNKQLDWLQGEWFLYKHASITLMIDS